MILLTQCNYTLYIKHTHTHKAAKPSGKASEVQNTSVLSLGKIHNPVMLEIFPLSPISPTEKAGKLSQSAHSGLIANTSPVLLQYH